MAVDKFDIPYIRPSDAQELNRRNWLRPNDATEAALALLSSESTILNGETYENMLQVVAQPVFMELDDASADAEHTLDRIEQMKFDSANFITTLLEAPAGDVADKAAHRQAIADFTILNLSGDLHDSFALLPSTQRDQSLHNPVRFTAVNNRGYGVSRFTSAHIPDPRDKVNNINPSLIGFNGLSIEQIAQAIVDKHKGDSSVINNLTVARATYNLKRIIEATFDQVA